MRKALQRQADQPQTPTRALNPQTASSDAHQHRFNFSAVDIFPKSTHASGAGIAQDLRTQMEASFQSDFSSLKIFEDHSASQLHAKAYAHGETLYFAPGRYDPSSQAGLELLGHELAHVVQQRQGVAPSSHPMTGLPSSLPWSRINTDRALEREADTLGRQAARGERASVAPRSGVGAAAGAPVIQASPEDETRLHEDLEKRANAVWQSHGSPQGQDQSAQTADWSAAHGQQKFEIERRANLEYHKRFTADGNEVKAPAHSDELMIKDYGAAETDFKRELRNREHAGNPINSKGIALTTSGEFDNIGKSGAAAKFTNIEQHTPDPSNPGKLSDARKRTQIETLLHSDLEKRANSVWQSHGSAKDQNEFARAKDWNTAQRQQKSEIERRANLEYHKRFTADDLGKVITPEHSNKKMMEDYFKGEDGFNRELRNREHASNPSNTKGIALTTSGEFGNIGRSRAAATITNIEQHTPDPTNPGKLSPARKDLLEEQLEHSGRIDFKMPSTYSAPTKSSLKESDPVQYAESLKDLGHKRPSGIQESVVEQHLGKYFEDNSNDSKFETGHAPLDHAHSAHGFQIPLGQQVERLLYGIRPDKRVENIVPNNPLIQPIVMPDLRNKGKDETEKDKISAISISSYPPGTLTGNVKARGAAGGFGSALTEYNSLNQNLAQAWQSKEAPEFIASASANPNAPLIGKNVAVTSKNVGNPVQSTHTNSANWTPESYGLGFKFNSAAPDLRKADDDVRRAATTQTRAAAITAEQQYSSMTIVKKVFDRGNRMNGFDVTTNYPSKGNAGLSTGMGAAAASFGSTFRPEQTNAQNDETDLAASLARIDTSTTGNIPYERDALGKLIPDPVTGNPLPELDSNGKPIKQGF